MGNGCSCVLAQRTRNIPDPNCGLFTYVLPRKHTGRIFPHSSQFTGHQSSH